MTLLAFALTYGGWWALAAGMARHGGPMLGRGAFPAVLAPVLRATGGGLLVLSFFTAAGEYGWDIGPVAWCGLGSVGAVPLVLMLAWRPALAALPVAPLLAIGWWLSGF
ncbi:DUF3325 domain-containing protein [Telmatospirillum siberiense]|nr:DUF3325 domain-containing protein [Telmatospirillum siberiense]